MLAERQLVGSVGQLARRRVVVTAQVRVADHNAIIELHQDRSRVDGIAKGDAERRRHTLRREVRLRPA